MSIESQRGELERVFRDRSDVIVVAVFEESKSAKSPGRPVFADMVARIENGEAEGILAWAPDRLARNSIDGGRVVYLLDCGVLRDLKFATYTFENNSQGKFMLSIMFGQSKYYSDSLSENVKRGNRTKREKGWRPNKAPLGYCNAPDKTITTDPVRFPLIRHMFELVLSGVYSPREVTIIARDEWGFRTPMRKRSGGNAPCLSTTYKILGNQFYAGLIVSEGQVYQGKHQAVVTLDEFNQVQKLLKRPDRPRPQKHVFPFTGLIKCGSCGNMVTAERRTKPSGSQYVYYHCTKRGLGPRCPEPAVTASLLEQQITTYLSSIVIHPCIEEWLRRHLRKDQEASRAVEIARHASVKTTIAETERQVTELTSLRLRRLVSDDEFIAERQRLEKELIRLEAHKETRGCTENRFELFEDVMVFSKYALEFFNRGDENQKRLIAKNIGSNFSLSAKKVSFQAAFPFLTAPLSTEFRHLCGEVQDVRNIPDEMKSELNQYAQECCDQIDAALFLNLDILMKKTVNDINENLLK